MIICIIGYGKTKPEDVSVQYLEKLLQKENVIHIEELPFGEILYASCAYSTWMGDGDAYFILQRTDQDIEKLKQQDMFEKWSNLQTVVI